ncbi:MAG: hypothetical protein ND895_00745, partial [Pyrinomonadaceae bacterium]|nr:hypothetical protein [Pyrinomonadaceae bacterium]
MNKGMHTKGKRGIIATALICALVFATAAHAQTVASATTTKPAAADATNGQSETEPTAATVKKKTAQAISSGDRSAKTSADKVAVVAPSSAARVREASERDTTDPQTPAPAANDAAELAKKLSNPLASMISLPMQSNFDFRMGTGSGWKYTLNMQPVIPIALSPKW